jgi:sigma-B regulation protein RsbU (phosphoserine phosphatase)
MVSRRVLTVVGATGAAMVTYAGVRGLEAMFVYLVQPPRGEMRSLSHAILTAAFGVAIYLWLDLRATRAVLTGIERSQLVVDTQLALAADVQRRLLPAAPPTLNRLRWASQLRPAGKIGGDFYDFIPSGHDSTLVLVGDVSGKGIPAALLQTSAHSLFRTFARDTRQPAELLSLVSREIYAENGGALYLTCIVVRIDGTPATLIYANAGHPTGLLLGKSGRRLLSSGGPPVGMFPETIYQSEVLRVEAGDVGVIVTDGITEAIEQDGVSTDDRLNATVSNLSPPWTPERLCDALMALADDSVGPPGVPDWQDDKTVLAFMVEGETESVHSVMAPFVLAEPQAYV